MRFHRSLPVNTVEYCCMNFSAVTDFAIASAISHVFLLTGFLIFSYFDAAGAPFGQFLFNNSEFSRLMRLFWSLRSAFNQG